MTGPIVEVREKSTGEVVARPPVDAREMVEHPDQRFEYALADANPVADGIASALTPTATAPSADAASVAEHAPDAAGAAPTPDGAD